jgi:hypothetical protein
VLKHPDRGRVSKIYWASTSTSQFCHTGIECRVATGFQGCLGIAGVHTFLCSKLRMSAVMFLEDMGDPTRPFSIPPAEATLLVWLGLPGRLKAPPPPVLPHCCTNAAATAAGEEGEARLLGEAEPAFSCCSCSSCSCLAENGLLLLRPHSSCATGLFGSKGAARSRTWTMARTHK